MEIARTGFWASARYAQRFCHAASKQVSNASGWRHAQQVSTTAGPLTTPQRLHAYEKRLRCLTSAAAASAAASASSMTSSASSPESGVVGVPSACAAGAGSAPAARQTNS